jgi:DUF1016 N-terminal domain
LLGDKRHREELFRPAGRGEGEDPIRSEFSAKGGQPGTDWHGAAIAERLADDLRKAFPGVSGFSCRNVFYMREFFLLYRDNAKVQPLVAQIGWSKNVLIHHYQDAAERSAKAAAVSFCHFTAAVYAVR